MPLNYVKLDPISIKAHPELDERWLQDRIAEDTSLLGLGDLRLIDRERRQGRAGRLDLLLTDADESVRFEVELQLGASDESHIIRTLEYWDIERRRYPGYEHVAVLIAEDITSRFLNVLQLFGGTIPFVALQLIAVKTVGGVGLHVVKVLDQRELRTEDTASDASEATDRSYWEGRTTPAVMQAIDKVFEALNAQLEGRLQLNYNRHYIGLTDGHRSNNFVHFIARKKYFRLVARPGDVERWRAELEDAGLDAEVKQGVKLSVRVDRDIMREHQALLDSLLSATVERHRG